MKWLVIAVVMGVAACPALAQKPDTMTIKLYYLTEKDNEGLMDCNKVLPVTRKIPKTKAVATAALEELFKGPTAEEEAAKFFGLGPEETKGILKSVQVKRGAAYVNFTKLVYEQMGTATTSCGSGFFATVERTLTQFPTIKKIYYAIEGSTNDFYELVQVGECPHGRVHCASSNFK